jgi:hypothetical protein
VECGLCGATSEESINGLSLTKKNITYQKQITISKTVFTKKIGQFAMQIQPNHLDPAAGKNSIHRFVSLLGSSIGRRKDTTLVENSREANVFRPTPGKLSDLFNSMSHHETVLYVPSLSLKRSSQGYHAHPLSTKQDVEEHAASNLSTPIVIFTNNCRESPFPSTKTCVETDVTQFPCELPFQAPCSIDNVPTQMLENLKESFGILVDARLREYIKILARHAFSLAECPGLSKHEQEDGILTVEQKIRLLFEFGSRMEVHYMCTSFQAVGNDLSLTMTMEILVPSLGPSPSRCTILAKTSGNITGKLMFIHVPRSQNLCRPLTSSTTCLQRP